MTPNSVFCIAFSRIQADQMVKRLRGAAFSTQYISELSATGPIVAALGDMVTGLLKQGVPAHKARIYQVRVLEGRILISVQTWSDEEIFLAREILSKAGGNDICATKEPMQAGRRTISPRAVQMHEPQLSLA